MASAAVKRYWSKVAELGCIICERPAQIAHCHNGSVRERMRECKAKGKKLARFDWVVLPLCPQHHHELDVGVRAWETCYGTQVYWIDRIANWLGVRVWELAQVGSKTMARRAT